LLATLTGCGSPSTSTFIEGKDTVASFSDGRYQVLKVNRCLALHDSVTQHTIIHDIRSWYRTGNHIYAVNHEGRYAILDLSTGADESFDK